MKIDKILNNNVVISKNGFGEEVVCMGKGLAFQKKSGDEISPEAVQKEFVLRDSFAKNQFQQLMADIPAEEIEWVKQVVELAEDKLKVEFSPNIYLTLTDHLHYAITRAKENIQLLIHYYLKQKNFIRKNIKQRKRLFCS